MGRKKSSGIIRCVQINCRKREKKKKIFVSAMRYCIIAVRLDSVNEMSVNVSRAFELYRNHHHVDS